MNFSCLSVRGESLPCFSKKAAAAVAFLLRIESVSPSAVPFLCMCIWRRLIKFLVGDAVVTNISALKWISKTTALTSGNRCRTLFADRVFREYSIKAIFWSDFLVIWFTLGFSGNLSYAYVTPLKNNKEIKQELSPLLLRRYPELEHSWANP